MLRFGLTCLLLLHMIRPIPIFFWHSTVFRVLFWKFHLQYFVLLPREFLTHGGCRSVILRKKSVYLARATGFWGVLDEERFALLFLFIYMCIQLWVSLHQQICHTRNPTWSRDLSSYIFTLIDIPVYFVSGATEVYDFSMLIVAEPSTFSEPGPISLQVFPPPRSDQNISRPCQNWWSRCCQCPVLSCPVNLFCFGVDVVNM